MKTKKIDKNFIIAGFLAFFAECLLLFSCKTTRKIVTLQETIPPFTAGLYSYDYNRRIYGIENAMQPYQYKSEKIAYGEAVFIDYNRSFFEPELQITIHIGDDNSVSCTENPTVCGIAHDDGRVELTCTLRQNERSFLLVQRSLLLKAYPTLLAGEQYNGIYKFPSQDKDITVKNGVYYSELPGTINADGTFTNGFTMSDTIGIAGFGESAFFSEFKEEGRLFTNGELEVKTYSNNSGAISSNTSQSFVYSGTKTANDVIESEKTLAYRKRQPEFSAIYTDGNYPAWFNFSAGKNNKSFYACGEKSAGDKDTAMNIAVSEALAQISALISVDIYSELSVKQVSVDSKTELHELVEQFTSINLPYAVTNSFFDEKTGTAYVRIEVPLDFHYD